MLVLFVLFLTISALLVAASPRNPSNRWAAYTFLSAGSGYLSQSLAHSFTLNGQPNPMLMPDWYRSGLDMLIGVSAFASIVVFPFCYLIYALYGSGIMARFQLSVVRYILAVPILIHSSMLLHLDRSLVPYSKLLIWVAPYLVAGSALLVAGALRKGEPLVRQGRIITAIFFVPPVMIDLFTGYVSHVLKVPYLMQINTVLGVGTFVAFVIFIVKTGILGIRIRLERQQLHAAMTGHVLGTTKLNHALKNQIAIINLHLYRMKQLVGQGEASSMEKQIQGIRNSTDHLMDMSNRIGWQTQQLRLLEGEHRLTPLIEHACSHPLLAERCIKVTTRFNTDATLLCDAAHLRELFMNLFLNAVEAMDGTGELVISVDLKPDGGLAVEVADNGPGIADDVLPLVLQPFFTTKPATTGNFGLGLSYCYQVMQEHGGSLRLYSRMGSGTTVVLGFPRKRVLEINSPRISAHADAAT